MDSEKKGSAAHLAAKKGHQAAVTLLHEHGADFSLPDKDGQTVNNLVLANKWEAYTISGHQKQESRFLEK